MLTKMVNGVSVSCSAQEEAAILAEWDANAAVPVAEPKPTLEDVVAIIQDDPVLSSKLDAQVRGKQPK